MAMPLAASLPSDVRQRFFKRMAELRSDGLAMRQIASRLEQEFKFPVSFSMVQRTLQHYADHNLPLANLGRVKPEKGRKTE